MDEKRIDEELKSFELMDSIKENKNMKAVDVVKEQMR